MTTTSHTDYFEKLEDADLNNRLSMIMDALDGLSYQQIDVMLANVDSAIKRQGAFRLDRSQALEFRNIKPPSRGA